MKRKSSSAAKSSVSTVKGEYRVTRLDGAGEEEDAEYKDELWEELVRKVYTVQEIIHVIVHH